jgi:hypothetical protein
MKYLSKIILSALLISSLVVACKKEGALPNYATGNAPALTSSKSVVAPTPSDSDNVVLTLDWTSPAYANDSTTTKYVIEIDSTGRNFAKAASMTVTGARKKTLTGRQLNSILLSFGFNFNVAYDIDVRVTSSYANNNDIKVSNMVYSVRPNATDVTNYQDGAQHNKGFEAEFIANPITGLNIIGMCYNDQEHADLKFLTKVCSKSIKTFLESNSSKKYN